MADEVVDDVSRRFFSRKSLESYWMLRFGRRSILKTSSRFFRTRAHASMGYDFEMAMSDSQGWRLCLRPILRHVPDTIYAS